MRPERAIARGDGPFTPRRSDTSRHLRAVPRRALRVADVALFHGERSGGIRTYLEAKASFAHRTGALDHHLIVPGPAERHRAGRHELPSLRLAAANGYRLPLGAGGVRRTLAEVRPDVVLLHDPFWGPLGVTRAARDVGARVVMVHHGSVGMDACGMPGPDVLWRPGLRAWLRAAYAEADVVMSACDPSGDCGRGAALTLRLGVHPAFAPDPAAERGAEVLYAGRLVREKGVFTLLAAAARSADPWPLTFMGAGPEGAELRRRAAGRGIGRRVRVQPYEGDPARLAARLARAGVVVMPGRHETFGLIALEAACAGAVVVTCRNAPAAQVLRAAGAPVETYAPGDAGDLERAIAHARARERDLAAAGALAADNGWDRLLEAETADLEALAA